MRGILFSGQEIEVAPEIWESGLQWNEHGDGKIAKHHQATGFFHYKVAEIANPVVVDVGACVGNYSIAAALHPGATVYAFEPNPGVFPLLQKQIELNGLEDQIFPFQYGLWHKEGQKVLAVHPRLKRAGCATFGDHPHRDRWDKIPVQVRKLDSFAHLWPDGVDIIKLDVEGAEWFVLRGGRRTIKRHKPALFMERNNTHLFNYSEQDLIETLKSWGYTNFQGMGIDIWVT